MGVHGTAPWAGSVCRPAGRVRCPCLTCSNGEGWGLGGGQGHSDKLLASPRGSALGSRESSGSRGRLSTSKEQRMLALPVPAPPEPPTAGLSAHVATHATSCGLWGLVETQGAPWSLRGRLPPSCPHVHPLSL